MNPGFWAELQKLVPAGLLVVLFVFGFVVTIMWLVLPLFIYSLLRQIRDELRAMNARQRPPGSLPPPAEGSLLPWLGLATALVLVLVWLAARV